MKAFLKKPYERTYLSNEEGFKYLRDAMYEIEERFETDPNAEEEYLDAFNEIREYARIGSIFAQDYLGYAFKKGTTNLVPENYELSMKWFFLAGSNGNEQSILRLKLFFARSYDDIFAMDNVAEVLAKKDIYQENFEVELGKLFCDAMVDALGLTAEGLFNEKISFLPSNLELANKYEKIRSSCIDRVKEYLLKE